MSSDFGQLAVSRHFSSGIDWPMAGAATVDVAIPTLAALRNSLRFMVSSPLGCLGFEFLRRGRRTLQGARIFAKNAFRQNKERAVAPGERVRFFINRRTRNVYREVDSYRADRT